MDVLDDLNERDMAIVFMYKECEMFAYDIAKELHIPESTVRTVLEQKGLIKHGNTNN